MPYPRYWTILLSVAAFALLIGFLTLLSLDSSGTAFGKPGPGLVTSEEEVITLLLLIPFGALVISVMRNIVGLITLGLFAPILYALAFLSSGLLLGVMAFLIVLALGSGLRNALDWLGLHPLPRLSIILSGIVLVFVGLIKFGNINGMVDAAAFGAFPVVIWASSVERVFNLSEEIEGGVTDILKLIGGTLAVTIVIYLTFQFQALRQIVLAYPVLILVPIGAQVAIGRYRGLRVTELVRFREIWRSA